MLTKAPEPDDNHRPRQSISEWGPAGFSVIQEEKEAVLGLTKPGGGE